MVKNPHIRKITVSADTEQGTQLTPGNQNTQLSSKVAPVDEFADDSSWETALSSAHQSKQDIVVDLLQRDDGASIDELIAATGWQKHSVRGLISGTLKKKLGLNVLTEKTAEGIIYHIALAASEASNA